MRVRAILTISFMIFISGIICGLVVYAVAHWIYRGAQREEQLFPLSLYSIPQAFPEGDLAQHLATIAKSYHLGNGRCDIAVCYKNVNYFFTLTGSSFREGENENAVYEIASITKLFVGNVAHQVLLVSPLVSIESPISELPFCKCSEAEFKDSEGRDAITYLDLITHHSGLPRLPDDFPHTGLLQPYRDSTFATLHKSFCTSSVKPSSSYDYSNFGYAILGHLIEGLSGNCLETEISERIAKPLGLVDTGYSLSETQKGRLISPMKSGRDVEPWEMSAYMGAGGMYSTVSDLLKFAAAHFNEGGQNRDQMLIYPTKKLRPADSAGTSIGISWHIDSENALDVFWHNGQSVGSQSYIGMIPDHEIAVAVLTNNSKINVEELGRRMLYVALRSD